MERIEKIARALERGVLALLVLACALQPLAWASSAGRTTANYLKVDVGARAVALAGNQFGADGDSYAQYYNPSFLATLSRQEVGFMHNEFISDFREEVLTYAHPSLRYGTLAAGITEFSYGSIAGYSASGMATGNVEASDLMFNVGWGKSWNFEWSDRKIKGLSTGANLKVLRKTLADVTAMGFALDLGFSYPFASKNLQGLRIAGAVQNLGPGLSFDTETSPLPRTMRLGLAYSFWGEALTTMVDGVMPYDGGLYPDFGVEYKLLKIAAIRLGYKGDPNLDKPFTFGIGFENPLFRVDYSFVPFGDLGDAHRISIVYRFGKSYKRTEADEQLQERVNEAKTLYAQGELIDAYLEALQIKEVAPWLGSNTDLLNRIAKDFKALEESDKKEKIDNQIAALMARGEKFFEEGNLINARLDFQAILGLKPDDKAAQGYLKQIEGQFRSFVESFYRNGMVAFAAEDYDKAKEEFEKVLVIQPDHAEARAQLARCLEILDKKQKQVAAEAKKDQVSRDFKEALDAYKDGNLDKAVSLFREVLRLDPRNGEAQRYLDSANDTLFKRFVDKGKEYAGKGEWENAIKNLRSALDINPNSKDVKSLLGDVERRWDLQKKVLSENLYKEGLEAFLSGDQKKAKLTWQRAVELDPDNQEARRGLSRISAAGR